jgi:hypothetical protein
MSDRERTGYRTLIYSGWHRKQRIQEYIGAVKASMLTLIDIDCCEACCRCSAPVALIETAAQLPPKNAPIMSALARMAGIPAFSVGYVPLGEPSVCGSCGKPDESDSDIREFHVRQLMPAEGPVRIMRPKVYAYWLLSLREAHECSSARERRAS